MVSPQFRSACDNRPMGRALGRRTRGKPAELMPEDRKSGPDELADLFARHGERVYGFLLARSGSRTVAEDLTSVTFEHAARAHAHGSGSELTEAWLVTVARRRLVDHWRSVGRDRRRLEQMRNRLLLRHVVDRRDDDIGGDLSDDVELALSALPERQRAALALRYLDDFSVPEVAEALDCSYQSAESLLGRARRGFAAAMEEVHEHG